jgi:hypothetical protein
MVRTIRSTHRLLSIANLANATAAR